MYYVYILKCIDGTLYTGSAKNVTKRLNEHFSASPKCAKYTRSHPPKEVVAILLCEEKSDAMKLEYRIKKLSKPEKIKLYELAEIPEKIKDKLNNINFKRISCSEYDVLLPSKA